MQEREPRIESEKERWKGRANELLERLHAEEEKRTRAAFKEDILKENLNLSDEEIEKKVATEFAAIKREGLITNFINFKLIEGQEIEILWIKLFASEKLRKALLEYGTEEDRRNKEKFERYGMDIAIKKERED